MPKIFPDGVPTKRAYEPPPLPPPPPRQESHDARFMQALSDAIIMGFRNAAAQIPAPVVNVPKPEVKINAPVYVTAPEIKVPPTTVNVPEGKAPVVNIEPAAVTLKTERPNKWHFKIHRNELGQMTEIDAEAR